MKKILRVFLIILIGILLFIVIFLFVGFSNPAKQISWGVNFSLEQTSLLSQDWRKVYYAILDDLKVKNIKISTQWNLIEPENGNYIFDDFDLMIREAESRNANIIMVVGLKTLRWPECHFPEWAKKLDHEEREQKILDLIKEIVLRYSPSTAVRYWQVENEPFLDFGDCPPADKEFLKKEISLVKSLDQAKRPIIISDSGEASTWFMSAKLGDVVGTTLYKKVWFKELNSYFTYPFPALYYKRKSQLINLLFNKKVICVEAQAEPWCPNLINNCSIKEQQKTMDFNQFQKNLIFVKNTGFDQIYFWGVEWWYWMKESQNDSHFWNEAKKIFSL